MQTKIIFDGETVIEYLYRLLDDEDGTLVVDIPNDVDAAKATEMTLQRFTRALLYLKGKGYIDGDTSYAPASHGGTKRRITITSNGIDYVEKGLI